MKEAPDQRAIFLARSCADMTVGERKAFLDRVCRNDAELRRQIETELGGETVSQVTQAYSNDYENALPRHYRLIEMIGRGGMAEVFAAEDRRLNRKVAIKFLNSEFRKNPERMRRFNQEARAASALNHPNILIIHDIGENEGVQFIVSEFIDGETLGSRISRGKIPLDEAVEISIQVASALAASHKSGIVHRDIKPDNVMLRPDGSVKVLDFGLAKEAGNPFSNASDFDANTIDSGSTSPGLILGTPQYMSPEQARGSTLDNRTDIFSLGILIFEMVAGQPPFSGKSMVDIIAAIIGKEPQRLEEYLENPPVALIRIIQNALQKNRDDRYQSMENVLSDLKALRNELENKDYSARDTGKAPPRTTLHHTVRTVADKFVRWEPAVLVIVVGILAGLAWWYVRGSGQATPGAPGSMRSVGITSWSSGTSELVTAASFSPDARMIAFASARSGSSEIWVKPIVGGDPIQVTKSGFYSLYPVWSPSGQEIAFFSRRGTSNGIWRTAFTGGDQTQIAGGLGSSARLVCWSESGKLYIEDGFELYSIEEKSGERRQLTDFGSQNVKPRSIEISADESWIAYSVQEADQWKLKVKRLNSEPVDEIAVAADQIDHLAWNPDGKSIVYSSSVDGAFQIFEAALAKNEPVQLSNGNLDFYVEDVSRDGSKILYGSVSETSDLWKVDVKDQVESLVANDVAAEYWPNVAADGKIAFQSVGQIDRPFKGAIHVTSAVGQASVQVAKEGFSPSFASDGSLLAFFRRVGNDVEIWRVKPTGDEAIKLTDHSVQAVPYTVTPYLKGGTNHVGWSADNKLLAYSAKPEGISNIWTVSADGSWKAPISGNTDRRETFHGPTWSPDGKQVAFHSDLIVEEPRRQMLYRLWVYRFDGAEQRMVYESMERFRFLGFDATGDRLIFTERADPAVSAAVPALTNLYALSLRSGAKTKLGALDDAYFHNVHLSRDGRTMAYVSRQENTTAMWTVPVDDGTPKRLLFENDPKVLFSSLAWSPDGNSIVFGKQTRTNLISMLTR